ncbi:MAG: response regulator [Terriglobia bacterium]
MYSSVNSRKLRQQLADREAQWAGISHDVSNLLTVVLGNSELLLARSPADQKLRPMLKGILNAGELAAGWMRQGILRVHAEQRANSRTDLKQVVEGMEDTLRLVAGESIRLHVECASEAVPVIAEPVDVERIILNLAMNARDALPDGGDLTIEVEVAEAQASRQNGFRAARAYGRLAVSDTGKGISREAGSRIFDSFYSTKVRHLGLGLPTARALVERNGGFIELESTPGLGATFYVWFPSAPEAPKMPEAEDLRACSSVEMKRILVAEDNPTLRAILSRTLESAGYNILEASDGIDALACYEKQTEPIDLLITDVRMARMDGLELGEALRARQPQLKIIYISGWPEDGAREGKSTSLFLKPFKPTALLREVREALK